MPSKKRKYNARFPAGRIKKIMQTDEEVGKVAQAVPVIICGPTPRTLELFVESLLRKSMNVTTARNAKTLSPSHVKQCILAESRFDFLKDLVKNIPDVSAADEKEDMSSENSPNSSRFVDMPPPNTQRSAPHNTTAPSTSAIQYTRQVSAPVESINSSKQPSPPEPSASFNVPATKRPAETSTLATAIGYAKRSKEDSPSENLYDISQSVPMNLTVQNTNRRVPNFYQETLIDEPTEKSDTSHSSVIHVNPKYTGHTNHNATTSTNESTNRTMLGNTMPKIKLSRSNHLNTQSNTSQTNAFNIRSMETVGRSSSVCSPSPLINIDFTKNFSQPEIKFVRTEPGTANMMMENINKRNTLTKQLSAPIIMATIDGIASSSVVRNSQTSYTKNDLDKHNLDLDEDYDT